VKIEMCCDNGYKMIMNTNAVGSMLTAKKEKYFDKLKKLGAEFV